MPESGHKRSYKSKSRSSRTQPQSRSHTAACGPVCPTLRANPFPEVTDLFCRLPLSTLFYQLEAVHLGDLLRLWVRLGVKMNLSLGFSRAVRNAPDNTKLYCFAWNETISPTKSISWWYPVKKKRELFPGSLLASPSLVTLPYKNPHPSSGILTWCPFDRRSNKTFKTEFPYLLGSTNPCPTAVHTEPFSTSVFKVLIWIFATTTKICTRGCFSQTYV